MTRKTSLLLALALGAALGGPRAAAAEDLAITGVRLYADPDTAAVDGATVLVHAGRVLRAGPSAAVPVPPGYRVLRRPGTILTAGFWNCHVHLTTPLLLGDLRRVSDGELGAALDAMFSRWGFTTVFDLGSTMEVANGVRTRLRGGHVTGPRILTVGAPFYPPGGTPVYAAPFYRTYHLPSAEVNALPAALARLDRQVREGADGVKLFTGAIVGGGAADVLPMPVEDVEALAAEAHRLGRPVFAHPTDRRGVELAVDHGVDVLAHVAPLAGPWDAAWAAHVVSRRVALIPTLALFADDPDPRTPVETGLQQLEAHARAGGEVLFGTDAGFTDAYDPTAEYRLMARVLPWRAILASLTTTPARRFGRGPHDVGRVVPGARADLVVLAGDPAQDPAAFGQVVDVVQAGRWRPATRSAATTTLPPPPP